MTVAVVETVHRIDERADELELYRSGESEPCQSRVPTILSESCPHPGATGAGVRVVPVHAGRSR